MAGFLIAVFFTSQAFSCCLVNHKLGQYLVSAWTRYHGTVEEHACCPSSHKESGNPAGQPESHRNGCCIQDANQKVPQVGSEQAEIPSLALLVVGTLPAVSSWKPSHPVANSLQTAAGPPIYLATLRLLI